MNWDEEDDRDDVQEPDPDLAYERYRDKILDSHPSGCSILHCLCGKGTPFSPAKETKPKK